MDIQTLVNELSIIYENDENNIIFLYRELVKYTPVIKKYTSNDLYKKIKKEISNIEYEIVFGNNDSYTNDAITDCLKTLKEVIDDLISIEENT